MSGTDGRKGGCDSDDGSDVSDSPGKFRKVSTSKQVRSRGPLLKEGNLLICEPKFSLHKWKERYFQLRPRTLSYARKKDDRLLDDIDLVECTIAESGNKNQSCSFKVRV